LSSIDSGFALKISQGSKNHASFLNTPGIKPVSNKAKSNTLNHLITDSIIAK